MGFFDDKNARSKIQGGLQDRVGEYNGGIELDIKVKCVEEHMTQADIAKKVETLASYVNKLIRRDEGVVNNTYVKMLEALGYDIELHYVKREE